MSVYLETPHIMGLKEKIAKVKCRTVLSMLVFWGQIQNYMMRSSMSLIVLAMVKTEDKVAKGNTAVYEEACVRESIIGVNRTSIGNAEPVEGKVEWDESMIPLVLSSFFWGYMSTQIIGGRLAEMFGFKKVYGFGLFIPGVLMLLHPVAARIDVRLFLALRALVGVFEAVTWPAMHAATARWVPADQRSSWVAQTYFGSTFGNIITLPMCGIVISSFGWEACFYIISAITLTWSLVWYLLAFDQPKDHPRISQEELEELSDIPVSVSRPPVPWLDILKSGPMWGTLLTDCANTNFAGTLLGITNTASGGGMSTIARLVCGAITSNNNTWEAWRTIFWIASVIYVVGNLVYVATIRAKPQYWNDLKTEEEKEVEKQDNGK
jgi:MFS family permease